MTYIQAAVIFGLMVCGIGLLFEMVYQLRKYKSSKKILAPSLKEVEPPSLSKSIKDEPKLPSLVKIGRFGYCRPCGVDSYIGRAPRDNRIHLCKHNGRWIQLYNGDLLGITHNFSYEDTKSASDWTTKQIEEDHWTEADYLRELKRILEPKFVL